MTHYKCNFSHVFKIGIMGLIWKNMRRSKNHSWNIVSMRNLTRFHSKKIQKPCVHILNNMYRYCDISENMRSLHDTVFVIFIISRFLRPSHVFYMDGSYFGCVKNACVLFHGLYRFEKIRPFTVGAPRACCQLSHE